MGLLLHAVCLHLYFRTRKNKCFSLRRSLHYFCYKSRDSNSEVNHVLILNLVNLLIYLYYVIFNFLSVFFPTLSVSINDLSLKCFH